MWRFKPFMPKEQARLEGRTIDIGNLKVHIRNVIAEGGFSCVYLARDAIHSSKQYALKHIICNDQESLDLVMKEISVMELLRGHPNVVALLAHTILEMGRTKEALLVMEFCEKSLFNVLESRGSGYFEEKQILLIFRDVCNAVFAMHYQSPPIAHRDLKAENLLLGPDGMWKLCDFGSISTNHKRFERPEEMGIEEDNIRKHTTPAYRAPEMWDLFQRELLNEKVDIWALGCLLYRICYFKSAFDGESKLQILNGNYRIPELPKYSSSIRDLIRDMLQASPDSRPDITQVWFCVNAQLPVELQKSLPERPADMPVESVLNSKSKSTLMPHRSPPPLPSSKEKDRKVSPPSTTSKAGGGGGPLGAFWSTQHVNDSLVREDKNGLVFDEPSGKSTSKHDRWSPENSHHHVNAGPKKEQNVRGQALRNVHGNSIKKFDNGFSEEFEIRFFPEDTDRGFEKTKASQSENMVNFQNDMFNTFVAEFDTSKLDSGSNDKKLAEEKSLEAEVDRLKEALKQTNLEKEEMTSKYERLSAICRSQRQEIQELKQALPARTLSPEGDTSKKQIFSRGRQSGAPQQRERIEGTVLELQQRMFAGSSLGSNSKAWKAFSDGPKMNDIKSVQTINAHLNKHAPSPSSGSDTEAFGTDSFTAVPSNAQMIRTLGQENNLQNFSDSKSIKSKQASQPVGWAGF